MYGKTPNRLFALVLCVVGALGACGGPESEEAHLRPEEKNAGATGQADRALVEERKAPPAPAEFSAGHPLLGEPLDHPEHYYGVYANPETPNRQWFVTEAKRPKYAEQAPEVPPGYLAVGAMFGDVAPWHMKTLSSTEFQQARVGDHEPAPATVEFELGGDGYAVAMSFTDERYASEGRLERQGDLPDGWE